MGLLVLGVGCGGTMKTGTAKRPANKPADDGTCPSERSLCGKGGFATCVDLQDDPNHCGTCDRTCAPGIACQAGVCQQTLCTGTSIPLSGQPATIASEVGHLGMLLLADVDGDGRLDLVDYDVMDKVGSDPNAFRVSLGQPGGGFASPDTYHSSFGAYGIFAMDANADGMDDLLVYCESHVELWLGHADGRLTRHYATDVNGMPVSVADLSGDGWPDVVTSPAWATLSVYLSDSTGALHPSKTYTTGMAIGQTNYVRDWDGDGSPDLVLWGDGLGILYNRGDGTFAQTVDCAAAFPFGAGEWGVVADFNRDGQMDVAMLTADSQAVPPQGARIGVVLGLGGCGFTPISYYDLPGSNPGLLTAVDMNGDGQLDLVGQELPLSNNGSVPPESFLVVLLGNPDGTFQTPGTAISLGAGFVTVTVGEATGDQRPDIVVTNGGGQTTVVENTCQ
jgi:hypothetical protein